VNSGVVGYTMLHYGVDYLASALQSLRDYVDQHVIIYSPTPTFGSQTTLTCPDSGEALRAIAESVLGKKLVWIEGLRQNYSTVMKLLPSTRLILETDADEIWTPSLTAIALRNWREGNLAPGRYRMPMVHHWRSFGYVCRDNAWPIRMFVPGSDASRMWPYQGRPIHHFGYARSVADTRYKIETSAHKGEWRAGWFDEVFLRFPDRLADLHPVVQGFWNAERYDRADLPDFMHSHPWFGAEVIT